MISNNDISTISTSYLKVGSVGFATSPRQQILKKGLLTVESAPSDFDIQSFASTASASHVPEDSEDDFPTYSLPNLSSRDLQKSKSFKIVTKTPSLATPIEAKPFVNLPEISISIKSKHINFGQKLQQT
mmetsp:Transcript_15127/g.18075  ORF Transcript_15127/g.18075 Transcript_15127/m.18075 type:complete len:129 (+) Transcript_15127:501-887(+)|eukprot:CAMPEP_0185596438 /NCGR_PEP_ID=MMETSP0434-20130131/80754_1 /TAXON_ID=626734 ORGANISM="Favella taraikaensis, Strain Fe Narragansett Bay" /NCGR_SAMPLE_ID=MMETSP0434 /ASSEMBLY_ACC=CAM_ASM_000379 /LENGTH=128 /DNA_ID=CAMNT_0028224941 /DNA_START=546 /DNA_END=932 /DNA_ORIENTATION=-